MPSALGALADELAVGKDSIAEICDGHLLPNQRGAVDPAAAKACSREVLARREMQEELVELFALGEHCLRRR
jgi:hypothetical protein